jgi:hypothetical protein
LAGDPGVAVEESGVDRGVAEEAAVDVDAGVAAEAGAGAGPNPCRGKLRLSCPYDELQVNSASEKMNAHLIPMYLIALLWQLIALLSQFIALLTSSPAFRRLHRIP